MVSRFRQEVKLARRVTHRNVARTFDIGEHEGERFLTMELVDGEPLDGMIARLGGLGQKRPPSGSPNKSAQAWPRPTQRASFTAI